MPPWRPAPEIDLMTAEYPRASGNDIEGSRSPAQSSPARAPKRDSLRLHPGSTPRCLAPFPPRPYPPPLRRHQPAGPASNKPLQELLSPPELRNVEVP